MTSKKQNKIIIITGQTGTGKTSLALKLAQKFNGELINSDSRQIYKYLDIITGKDKQFLAKVKMWLYDVINPNEHFSSFDFVKLAVPIINKIFHKGKTPIIVGGTYFYLHHLLYNVESENIAPDWKLRNNLENKSVKELQAILTKLSPELIEQLNQSELNNPQRLIRKIEIESSRHSGKQPRVLGGARPESNNDSGFIPRIHPEGIAALPRMTLKNKLGINDLEFDFIALKFKNKESLRQAIEKRVEERLKFGAVAEVSKLLKMGYSESDPGLKTIGYQQLISYLKGELDFTTAVQQWINKEVQYAKRQFTFMKKDKNIKWTLV